MICWKLVCQKPNLSCHGVRCKVRGAKWGNDLFYFFLFLFEVLKNKRKYLIIKL